MAKSSGLTKSLHTFPDQSGAGVNHAGQNLDKRCPGFDFIFGVFTGQNTTDTDNGNGIAQFGLELADDMRGQVPYRSAGKSSGFLSVFQIMTVSRVMVVLIAMTPSISWRIRASAMFLIWLSSISGAIFSASGTYLEYCCDNLLWAAFSCVSRLSSSDSPCNCRRFLVFGDEMLMAM